MAMDFAMAVQLIFLPTRSLVKFQARHLLMNTFLIVVLQKKPLPFMTLRQKLVRLVYQSALVFSTLILLTRLGS